MVAKNYKPSLDRVLTHEGGYSNHPDDPGGATMKGVIQRTYDAYRRAKGLKVRSVKSITPEEIQGIYDNQYWDAVKGDKLPIGIDYVVFDGGVNSGPVQSIKWLQAALRPAYKGAIDGQLGEQTLQAVLADNNNDALVDRICNARLAFLRHLRTWSTFGRGWSTRVSEVRSIGKAQASGVSAHELPEATAIADVQGKGVIEDAQQAPSTAPADAAMGMGVSTGGATGYLHSLQDQLSSFTSIDFVSHVVIGLIFTSAALVVGGAGYRYYVGYRAKKLNEALGKA
jgi:lysozyme family protein